MAATAQTSMTTTVTDAAGNVLNVVSSPQFNLGVGGFAVDQEVSLTNAVFTAFTVPTGAKAVRIRTNNAPSLVLKGITGDTGIPISVSATPLSDDIYLTLGATPALGILNNGASPVTVRCIWM